MRKSLVVFAAVALLAGCGDGDEQGETVVEGESLMEFFGYSNDDPEQMQAQFEEQQRQAEEHIAACMADQGFEYIPRDWSTQQSHPAFDLSPEEFRAEYGYGITTIDHAAFADTGDSDPNFEIRQALSEADQEAYELALHGEPFSFAPDTDPEEPVLLEPGGCQGEAQEAVHGAQQQLTRELGMELHQLFERVQADPRIVEAEQAWSACMRDAGWDFASRQDTYSYIQEKYFDLQYGSDGFDEPGIGHEHGDAEELAHSHEQEFELPELDPEALADIREEELAVAHADGECAVEHFGEEDELLQEVHSEYEREFIDEHRDVLEQLRED